MRITVLVPILLTFSSSVFATCYFPDGQESTLDTACDPNAIVSSCCFDRQACLSNGLCVDNPHDKAKSRTYRGTCTDRGWKSGNCVRQCFDNMHAGAPVYACNTTDIDSYCCYDNCKCEKPFEVFSFPEAPSAVSTKTIILEKFTPNPSAPTSKASTGSATLPASASTSPTGASSGAQTLSSNGGSPNYLALGIGLGLGLGLGIPLLFLAGFCIWRRKQAGHQSSNNTSKSSNYNNEGFYPLQTKHEYAEAPRTSEPAHHTGILPSEKDLAIQHIAELPDRQSRTLTAPATHAAMEKKVLSDGPE